MYRKEIKLVVCLALLLFFSISVVSAADRKALVETLKGQVEVSVGGLGIWKVCKHGMLLKENDKIRTGEKSFVALKLEDGTKIRLAAVTVFSIKTMKPEIREFDLNVGNMRAWVKKLTKNERFSTKTPTAVCAVRGTEFEIDVDSEKRTKVSLFTGLLAVRHVEGIGEEIIVHPNERLEILPDLMPSAPEPMTSSKTGGAMQAAMKLDMQQEVGMDMSREQVQAAAAQEMKLAEYQLGKSLIDVFGKRVRLEEYIVRPQPDTMKLVALSARDERFDYFIWKVQFDHNITSIPEAAKYLDWISGDSLPEYYVKTNEWNVSNTVDKIESIYSGGHIVDKTQTTSGKYELLFNNFLYKISNKDKIAYNPAVAWNIKSMNDITWTVTGTNMTQSQFDAWQQSNWQWTVSGERLQDKLTVVYPDNTTGAEEYFIFNDEGKVGSRQAFKGLSGQPYINELLKWNQELIFTATEFSGKDKKIDLVVEPKIFVDAGLIK